MEQKKAYRTFQFENVVGLLPSSRLPILQKLWLTADPSWESEGQSKSDDAS
jgi:hypothetical protein